MSKGRPALLIIGLGLTLILFALGYSLYQQTFDQVSPAPLPERIADLPLTGSLRGAPALDELSWLHGQEFQVNQAAVGRYGASGEITLYAAGTPLSFMTGRLLIEMRDRIASAESPFTPLAERSDGQRTVYELEGMGQHNYYFQSGDLVIWLAADQQYAEVALQQLLAFYP
jgi:hypothetical protein